MEIYDESTVGGVRLTPKEEMKNYNKIILCYLCKDDVGKYPTNTHGISICPDCVRRIVNNYISDLMSEKFKNNKE